MSSLNQFINSNINETTKFQLQSSEQFSQVNKYFIQKKEQLQYTILNQIEEKITSQISNKNKANDLIKLQKMRVDNIQPQILNYLKIFCSSNQNFTAFITIYKGFLKYQKQIDLYQVINQDANQLDKQIDILIKILHIEEYKQQKSEEMYNCKEIELKQQIQQQIEQSNLEINQLTASQVNQPKNIFTQFFETIINFFKRGNQKTV